MFSKNIQGCGLEAKRYDFQALDRLLLYVYLQN